jgi:hypothetical protein
VNDKIYIHEFIDIIGHHRADYMHHMAANWSPEAQVERKQLCYGIWSVIGSTGRWPEVVNLWEHDGWPGLAANFAHELSSSTMQDPSLVEWWAQAAEFRRGGVDRILVPAPWTRTIDELVAEGAGAPVYAHELVSLRPGSVGHYLEAVRDVGQPALAGFGLGVIGAFRVAMVNDSEAVTIWSVPSFDAWGDFEAADGARSGALAGWRKCLDELGADWRRCLMVDAPLAPLRLGRQPDESDRRPLDEV